MTDKIQCPYCERSFDLDQVENAELWRQRSELASRLGPRAWRVANEYLECFRVKPGARITVKKRVRHLVKLVALWETREFELDGKSWRTRRAEILAGMETVCELQLNGFKNHNYLKRILQKGAKRVSAEGMTAVEERERERKRRSGETGKRSGGDLEPVEYGLWVKGEASKAKGDG